MLVFALVIAACSGAPIAPATPPALVAPPTDAAVSDAAPADADVPDAVTNAPAWIFRYQTSDRIETWTLRTSDGRALLLVETAKGVARYVGTANDGDSLMLDVATANAKLSLTCKHAKRAVSAKCNDAKAKPIEILDCYHPDYEAPMPFGRAPGLEYVVEPSCNGYRVITPQ
ncbi:MAG: hypothetical protein AB7O24_07445 [Kofleriaceae bacterium]